MNLEAMTADELKELSQKALELVRRKQADDKVAARKAFLASPAGEALKARYEALKKKVKRTEKDGFPDVTLALTLRLGVEPTLSTTAFYDRHTRYAWDRPSFTGTVTSIQDGRRGWKKVLDAALQDLLETACYDVLTFFPDAKKVIEETDEEYARLLNDLDRHGVTFEDLNHQP